MFAVQTAESQPTRVTQVLVELVFFAGTDNVGAHQMATTQTGEDDFLCTVWYWCGGQLTDAWIEIFNAL
jgi:hypothetical protein